MEIIRKTIDENLILPKNFIDLYKELPFIIFDIETTGLSPNKDKVILIGVLYAFNNQIVIEQFFCNTRNDEKEVLLHFQELIQSFPLFISYNGDTFDIPFLNRRFENHRIPFKLAKHKSLDLLKMVRKIKNSLNLDNYKLKTIEKYLGINRQDLISGKESVELYKTYEISQEKRLKEFILLHNHDDLYYLSKCLHILDFVPKTHLLESAPLILSKKPGCNLYVNGFTIKSNLLKVSGALEKKNALNHIFYEQGFTFEYNHSSNEFNCLIPLLRGKLSSGILCYYLDMSAFPFSYDHNPPVRAKNIPQNILIVKEGLINNTEEVRSFITAMMHYLQEKI